MTSSTQISGNVSIPFNALSGPYRLDITTTDGGVVNKPNAFTVNAFPAPTITSITPTTPWYRNATVPFLITGTNFKSGQTTVAFNYPSNGTALNSTVAVNAVSATTISGTVVVPYSAPTGTWNVSVATIDGGTVWKPAAITVNQFPAPSITSITPAAGTKNSTVLFTLAGTNFEPVGTSVTIVEDTSGTVMNATLISVTPGIYCRQRHDSGECNGRPLPAPGNHGGRGDRQQAPGIHGQLPASTGNHNSRPGDRIPEHDRFVHPDRELLPERWNDRDAQDRLVQHYLLRRPL